MVQGWTGPKPVRPVAVREGSNSRLLACLRPVFLMRESVVEDGVDLFGEGEIAVGDAIGVVADEVDHDPVP